MTRRSHVSCALRRALTALGLFAVPLGAQTGASQNGWDPEQILRTETWVRPPAVVERIITAPRTDIAFDTPSPDRQWFLRANAADRGRIADYGKSHIYLAGVAIDTKANRARQLTMRGATALALVNPVTRATKAIAAPAGAKITGQVWSPAGTEIAYIANFDAASHIYVADVATGRSRQITRTPLLATLVTSLDWTADGRHLITVLVPDGRGPAPTHGEGGIEDGPQVRLTEGRVIPQRMHWSLLEDPHDQALLKYHTTGQLALIDVRTRGVRRVGGPTMFRAVDVSPDGQYVRVTRMVEPFSYRVPASSFGTVQELWDLTGKVVAELGRTPLREGDVQDDDAPPGGRGGGPAASDTGKRNLQWNPVGPGMVYLQSVFAAGNSGSPNAGRGGRGGRGGGARQPSSVRFMQWLPPYGPNDTKVLYEGSGRLSAVAWSADGATMFINDSTVFAVRTAEPGRRFQLGRGVTMAAGGGGGFGGRGGGRGGGGGTDSTAVGGALAMKRGPTGQPVVILGSDNRSVFLSGTRNSAANWHREGPRPWVDKLDFESGQRTRVFESAADHYDAFVTALDDDFTRYIYTRESPTVIADAYLRDTRAGTSTKLTSNVDVAPEVTGAHRKRFQVTRPRDSLRFWVEVTLPREWRPGTKLPGIIWFYPREFTSHAEYDRSKFNVNVNRFPEVPAARPATATKIWVTQGYAFIEPDLPILGDSGRMNDNYTQDLRESLDAVVDVVVDSGWVDRDRMGIGGHSYGAFSTVNAMTLVPYFKAGIAGDGMYNRSLTPFGFQSERRSFFEAQDTYLDMSPFFRADKLSGALLMYHASEDQNVGTAPLSSIRMLHALQGLGKTAALYMYPYEDHSVATYESDLDQWARWFAWFDLYVKNAGRKTAVP
jgi:dipeptidyl aminopeptidase/acylaminoacyl peptidase